MPPRAWHVAYSFILENGAPVDVCKVFFLATLGYTPKCTVIQELLKTPFTDMMPAADKIGKSTPTHALSEDEAKLIKEHIMSYNFAQMFSSH